MNTIPNSGLIDSCFLKNPVSRLHRELHQMYTYLLCHTCVKIT